MQEICITRSHERKQKSNRVNDTDGNTNDKKFVSWHFRCLKHCVKSFRIRSFSGPCSPSFRLRTERYRETLRIQSGHFSRSERHLL